MTGGVGTSADEVVARLGSARLIPVLVLRNGDAAVEVGRALLRGGLDVAEVTFRTRGSDEALAGIASVAGMCVGAGTVLHVEQVERAVQAGARFVVSPGLDADVVRRAHDLSIPAFPGVATATEVMSALRLGINAVKLFPAEHLGGVRALSALAAPFPGVRFIPTGGIGARSVASYLAHPAVLAVGGSWMAPGHLVGRRDWDQISALTADAVSVVREVEAERGSP